MHAPFRAPPAWRVRAIFPVPGFYAKHGYETIAVLSDYPLAHQKHFLKNSLPMQFRPVRDAGAT